MPKRIISDLTWTSKKVRSIQPPEFRPEYLWILPIADDNAVFEFDADVLWAKAYALARPGWDPEKVQAVLDELVRVKLVFKYEANGHVYGHFLNCVLPKPTERYNNKLPQPDKAALARFTSGDAAAEPPSTRPTQAHTGRTDMDMGSDSESGSGMGNESDSDKSQNTQPNSQPTTHTTTQNAQPEPNPVNQEGNKSTTKTQNKPPRLPYGYPDSSPSAVVGYFHTWIRRNPNAVATPANWEKLWLPDIEELLTKWGCAALCQIIEYSQTTKYAQYVFRGKTLMQYAPEIAERLKLEPRKEMANIDDI